MPYPKPYMHTGALLEMALINWAFQRVAAAGFIPITTPDLVRASVLEKCGFQPRAENTQVPALLSSPTCAFNGNRYNKLSEYCASIYHQSMIL